MTSAIYDSSIYVECGFPARPGIDYVRWVSRLIVNLGLMDWYVVHGGGIRVVISRISHLRYVSMNVATTALSTLQTVPS